MRKEACKAGVWVDHAKAWIVSIAGDETRTEEVLSHVDPHFRPHGGSRTSVPYGPQEKSSESRIEGHRKKQLHSYYRELCDRLTGTTEVLILGPEQARRELHEEIERRSGSRLLATVMASDRMTIAQLVAVTKEHFGIPPRRRSGNIRG
jgi:hypothetical protein